VSEFFEEGFDFGLAGGFDLLFCPFFHVLFRFGVSWF
jgi:hypothetical protein